VQLAELLDDDATFDVDQLTGMALQQRPELAALSAQATALREQAAGTQAKLAPQAALMGGYVYQQNQYMDPNGLGVLGVGIEWNAFDSGRVRNQADALCRKAESVLRMRKDAESQIALEVRQKWLDLQTARQRVQVARQATAQADENLRVAQNRYQQQAGTNTEVLDAESLRVQAYTNLYNSSYQSVLAGLRLRRAVGSL
jgi:outer membrane protein TolC